MTDIESFPSLEALLHRLGLIGESAQVECKKSALRQAQDTTWQLPRDIWETVSMGWECESRWVDWEMDK